MHFLQTIISNFQPINDLCLDLGKLQVLDLKNTQRRWSEQQKQSVMLQQKVLPRNPPMTHQLLQVADLIVSLVQESILVSFLLQQQQSFSVGTQTW